MAFTIKKPPPWLVHAIDRLAELPIHVRWFARQAWEPLAPWFSRARWQALGPWRAPLLGFVLLAFGIGLGLGVGAMVGTRKPAPPPSETGALPAPPAQPATAPRQPIPTVRNAPPIPPLALPNTRGAQSAVAPESGPYVGTPIPDAVINAPKSVPGGQMAAWLRNAVPFADPGKKPMVVVVMDDLGLDRKRTYRTLTLKGPLTLAFLAYSGELAAQTAAGRARGHELIIHVPMEPLGPYTDPGPDVLLAGMSPDDIRTRLRRALDRFPGYVGINNHMGSKFTADRSGMAVVLTELKARGLLFLDSKTTGGSVAAEIAREIGLPFAERNVFLDNEPSLAAVEIQLYKLEEYARQYGHAIAIGHPHDATLDALEAWLPTLDKAGLALVPLSAIVKRHANGNGNGATSAAKASARP